MKKITLLFTIICAGQMYGMEQTPYALLLPELKQKIVNMALQSKNNTLDEAINALKGASAFYKVSFDKLFGDLKDFTKLVHILAAEFNVSTKEVAEKFNIPIAQKYINLGEKLIDLVYGEKLPPVKAIKLYEANLTPKKANPNEIIKLIEDGADVNFTAKLDLTSGYNESPLSISTNNGDITLTKLLLKHGANPELAAKILKPSFIRYNEEVKELIKEAMKEQQ